MESSNIPAFQTEDYMPPETTLKYRVDFIYSEGFPEKDPAKFWKDYAKKQYGSVEEFVNKKKAMEQAVAQTISAGDSPEVKLQKIYARVQQLRNTSFEREKTEQELKREKQKEVNNVEDVWKRGYGGGRQITWLFLGLARAAGFEASPVLVSRRNVTFFNNNVMNPRELDDNVVQVMLNGKEVYLDPGTAFTPFGMLPWWETMVPGLKLSKDGGTWVQAPLGESSSTKIERKAELKLDNEGTLAGKLTVTYSGSEAFYQRLLSAGPGLEELFRDNGYGIYAEGSRMGFGSRQASVVARGAFFRARKRIVRKCEQDSYGLFSLSPPEGG